MALYYPCSKNKGADQISFAVTAKLICVFVFAYAKSRFSHDAAHIISSEPLLLIILPCFLAVSYFVKIKQNKMCHEKICNMHA